MTEEEFAEQLAKQLNDDRAGDETIGTVVSNGAHVYVEFGPATDIAGETFTLLVIKEK